MLRSTVSSAPRQTHRFEHGYRSWSEHVRNTQRINDGMIMLGSRGNAAYIGETATKILIFLHTPPLSLLPISPISRVPFPRISGIPRRATAGLPRRDHERDTLASFLLVGAIFSHRPTNPLLPLHHLRRMVFLCIGRLCWRITRCFKVARVAILSFFLSFFFFFFPTVN